MSRWPIIGKSRTAMAVLILLSCMLLFQACSAADCVENADIKDVELFVDCDYQFHIDFYSQPQQSVGSGFYVFFENKTVIEPDITKECVQISWNNQFETHSWKPASHIQVFNKADLPALGFAPANATGAVKIWVPEPISMNSNVSIWFKCGLSAPCYPSNCPFQDCPPCENLICGAFTVWVANDAQRCPQESTQLVKIIASSGNGGHVTYPPTGESAAPDFEQWFEYGSNATYLITGESHIIDTIDIVPLCEGAYDPAPIVYRNGTVQATYTFDPLQCSYKIVATFMKKPVYGYLKYQLPQSECRDIVMVKVWGTDSIQPMLNFTDDLYIGGDTAEFEVYGWSSGTKYGSFDGSYTDGSPSVTRDILLVKVTSNPLVNPETYNVTYLNTAGKTHYATVTILPNGRWIWAPFGSKAPYVPDDVTDIVSINAMMPAWQMVTQDYLDCNPEFEGLIGMTVEADDSKVYSETIEIDTPGVHLHNKDGTHPVIDAKNLIPKGDYPDGKSGAVYLSAGCTAIEGFTIKNSITNGVLVNLTSEKCSHTVIHDCRLCGSGRGLNCNKLVPCCRGRINIVSNDIFNNCENGIYVNDAVILISNNKIHDNIDDGIDAGCLFSGVECIDPEAITGSPVADSEIIYNTIYHNGHFPEYKVAAKGEWEVVKADGTKHFTSDPTACGELPGWTDAGIQIRCVGSAMYDGKPCGVPCQGPEPLKCIDCQGSTVIPCIDEGQCAGGSCFSGGCASGSCYNNFAQDDGTLCGGCNQTLYIVHNNVSANFHANIYLMENATQGGNITIQSNRIEGKDVSIFGLLTEAAIPGRIDFKWNDIWCNKYWGVKNLAPCDLIAKENYWGSVGGPSAGPAPIVECIDCRCHEVDQRSDALGNGDEVSHRVHYNPWLYSPWTCLDGTCGPAKMFGSDTLTLQCGWNTLSVPIKLAPEGDTFIEIAGLGKFITKDNFAMVLRWDAVGDKWVDAGASGEQILPGRGYYIKMKAPSKFPVIYNAGPSPGLTSVPVESGWNLIGSTWGIDRDDNPKVASDEGRWAIASPDLGDDEAFMRVTDALESIKDGNNGGRGVAIIVSPSVSGQYRGWSAAVTTGFWDPLKNREEMVTGDAYWVFMVNPGTYAGFEITPFYYDT